jgi:hypothetical protein
LQGDVLGPDGDVLTWCLQQPAVPRHKLRALFPDFLVISPPKTGSSWLAANLRCHPQLFMPAIKEVRYFNSLIKWLDLNWYLDQFGSGAGRVKGEASPSYAILPVGRIRLLRRLRPDLRLIFLMRDPVARAWSHAKHNHYHREANFASSAEALEAVPEAQWRENFTHAWPLACGDYLGQLRRWLSVFPREQVYVGFYESIAKSPECLLRGLFAFLGVEAGVDLSTLRLRERVLPGPVGPLSAPLRAFLQRLLHARSCALAAFLRDQFALEAPPEWQGSLAPPQGAPAAAGPVTVFSREFDDRYLTQVLEHEDSLPSGPRLVLDGYRGYDAVYYRGRFYAFDRTLGAVHLQEVTEAELRDYQESGRCLIAGSAAEVKERVDQHIFSRTEGKLQAIESLQAGLRDAGARLARLERDLAEGRYISPAHILRKVWRRLRATLKWNRWGAPLRPGCESRLD